MKQIRNKITGRVLAGVLYCCIYLCGCSTAEETWQLAETEAVKESETASVEREKNTLEEAVQAEQSMVCVYLCGAVNLSGVYQLPEGSRLYEAIEAAGGLTEEADKTCLNLARVVTDGEQITVFTEEEVKLYREQGLLINSEAGLMDQFAGQKSGLVNINTAALSELTALSGIGEGRAEAIIKYREEQGNFRTIEDIKKVEGIKEGVYEKIKDKITVG